MNHFGLVAELVLIRWPSLSTLSGNKRIMGDVAKAISPSPTYVQTDENDSGIRGQVGCHAGPPHVSVDTSNS
jgi:hypothetical protein